MFVQTFDNDLADFVAAIKAGQCIGLPTETVYGLAADATNGLAVARIFELKKRPQFNPLISHVGGLDMAKRHGVFSPVTEKLAEAFWPGPLTLVLPLSPGSNIHPLVTAGLGTIGLRMPRGVAGELISRVGNPLAAPSANLSGRISPTQAEHVIAEFGGENVLVIDDGPCEEGIESTIVKIDDDHMTLLRPGTITREEIFERTGILPKYFSGEHIEAPGMMKSHYAPKAQLMINQTTFPEGASVLAFGDHQKIDGGTLFQLSKTRNLREAASNLYRGLKTLDAAGSTTIYAQPIPQEGLGIAINDRLSRAAAPKES